MVATSRVFIRFTVSSLLLLGPLVWTACSTANGKTEDRQPAALADFGVAGRRHRTADCPVHSRDRHADRRRTGQRRRRNRGRVISTPVERGTRVSQGAELIRLSSIETDASVKEAEANAAQIEARLAQTSRRRLRRQQSAGSRQRARQLRARRVGIRQD